MLLVQLSFNIELMLNESLAVLAYYLNHYIGDKDEIIDLTIVNNEPQERQRRF